MRQFAVRVFGSVDHASPIIEIYDGEELIFEIVTSDDATSVDVLRNETIRPMENDAIAPLLTLVLPEWRAASIHRDEARLARDAALPR